MQRSAMTGRDQEMQNPKQEEPRAGSHGVSRIPRNQWDFQGLPRTWDPLMVSFPYYSHTTPIRIPKDMGIVWEAYHKGVSLLGVPGITIEVIQGLL